MDWFDNEEIWKSINDETRKRLEPFRPMVARLERNGYRVLRFDPGVVFIEKAKLTGATYNTEDCAKLDAVGWAAFDKILAENETLKVRYNFDNQGAVPHEIK